jgi:hypothetical protein
LLRWLPMSLEEVFIMAFNVVDLIRGRRESRAQGLEDLAKRLAAGEAIAPEDIEAALERTGTDEEALQAAIDRIDRRAELLAAVARGNAAQAKLDRIQGDIDKAWQVVVEAQERHQAVRLKNAEALAQFEAQQAAGQAAAEELLEATNLSPADRDRLAQARKEASEAAQAAEAHRRSIPDLKRSLETAEESLTDAQETARRFRGDAGAAEQLQRWKNAVAARGARLKAAEAELPALQAAADKAAKDVETIEDELRR